MERLFEKNGYLNAEGKVLGLNEFKLFTDLKNGDVIEERFKKGLIERAEKILDKEYPVCRATDYMMFTRTGDRLAYASRTYLRREDLVILVNAEIVEGEGRFLDNILNLMWMILGTG